MVSLDASYTRETEHAAHAPWRSAAFWESVQGKFPGIGNVGLKLSWKNFSASLVFLTADLIGKIDA